MPSANFIRDVVGELWVPHPKLITGLAQRFNSFLKHMPSVATRGQCCLVSWRIYLILSEGPEDKGKRFPLVTFSFPQLSSTVYLFVSLTPLFFLTAPDVFSSRPSFEATREEGKATQERCSGVNTSCSPMARRSPSCPGRLRCSEAKH